MIRAAAIATLFFLSLGGPARADIRIDDEPPRPKAPAPTPLPTSPPPKAEKAEKQGGCAQTREMAPEWLFGAAVLALGLGGLRRRAARPAAG